MLDQKRKVSREINVRNVFSSTFDFSLPQVASLFTHKLQDHVSLNCIHVSSFSGTNDTAIEYISQEKRRDKENSSLFDLMIILSLLSWKVALQFTYLFASKFRAHVAARIDEFPDSTDYKLVFHWFLK